ncbi:phosphonate ABC transporter, permease protein PhnE [Allopusillimonas soli]|uniref:Phosphonate ABC transporter, permease protein PhnE n=1 Tax=Allopusillimonas soli TaxID=659016 RepID=A0A853F5S6_9BURK|nr:phosphonate ABC transporter, permease protein PhnE [Allopusillimonas soli]NYT35317.1 phosphonate ABC transporter, permease protein PhnE [Allopusillimonas soli]TEA75739.1 phosphonate ABC transporter, permease protein PhnE [Allopusillimonas soli]
MDVQENAYNKRTAAPTQPDATWRRFKYPQSLYRYCALLLVLAFLAYAIQALNIDLARLSGFFGRLGELFSQRYYPPDLDYIMRPKYLHSVIETLQMSYLAAVLGIVISVPVSWLASYNMSPWKRVGYPLARLFIMGCRSVHEMIWTILLVAILGYGFLPGVLALTLFCIGFTGKLFSEAIEKIKRGPVEAVRATGAGELSVFVYAVLPQVRVAWAGISVYTWDVVFRAATVVGFFGAGGMGWYLRESMQLTALHDVAAILLSIIIVVIISEVLSAWVRKRVARAMA